MTVRLYVEGTPAHDPTANAVAKGATATIHVWGDPEQTPLPTFDPTTGTDQPGTGSTWAWTSTQEGWFPGTAVDAPDDTVRLGWKATVDGRVFSGELTSWSAVLRRIDGIAASVTGAAGAAETAAGEAAEAAAAAADALAAATAAQEAADLAAAGSTLPQGGTEGQVPMRAPNGTWTVGTPGTTAAKVSVSIPGLDATDVEGALEELAGRPTAVGSGSSDTLQCWRSASAAAYRARVDGAWVAMPATPLEGYVRREFLGTVAYTGATWPGVVDVAEATDVDPLP